ncbi:hypothetical protein AG1IA_07897 [Rhizoctonia solani AG-1 IA]|uniref:Uncharacterized protein n=1 Tax=Thanatephorus cucumeris (strain AG1-IA) TaxID=983506 RepID=L8WJF1_THACA|nr:hypothetical protein AG1IA_07897 [Rhizoctonia solani AG-1 IA]
MKTDVGGGSKIRKARWPKQKPQVPESRADFFPGRQLSRSAPRLRACALRGLDRYKMRFDAPPRPACTYFVGSICLFESGKRSDGGYSVPAGKTNSGMTFSQTRLACPVTKVYP